MVDGLSHWDTHIWMINPTQAAAQPLGPTAQVLKEICTFNAPMVTRSNDVAGLQLHPS